MYFEEASAKKNYDKSAQIFFKELKKLKLVDNISAIGFRVVAPTQYFTENRKINSIYLKKLKSVAQIEPLHTKHLITEIEQWSKLMPKVSLYGISDSNFHRTLSSNAKIYALSEKITKKYDIYRFGYHGISILSVLAKVKKIHNNNLPEKIIICHLSGGSSITAIKNGISIDTSMGFTPLEGVPMVSRVGNIDAAAVIYLAEKIGLKNLKNILFNNSGMIGLTNQTDMRKIVSLAQDGNKICLDAINLFVYNIVKYIGSYLTILEGLDLLIFTGGIGEESAFIRSLICKKLEFLDILLDDKKNSTLKENDAFLQSTSSKTQIFACKTDEMHDMFLELKKLI